jgi:hypothetical protein
MTAHPGRSRPGLTRLPRPAITRDIAPAGLRDHPPTATAAIVWNGDLPRPLQQILFDAADSIIPSQQRGGQEPPSSAYRR